MEPVVAVPATSAAAKIVAAIDLGTNALRMVIAQAAPTGRSRSSSGFSGRCGWARTPSAAGGWAPKA